MDGAAVGLLPTTLPAGHAPAELETATSPRLVELCFQTAGLWEMGRAGRYGLPAAIDRVSWLRSPREANGRICAVVRPGAADGTFDARVVDESGAVLVVLEGYRTIELPVATGRRGAGAAARGDGVIGFLLRRLSQVPADNGWLTTAERRWFNDRRSTKRVADWRLGRWTAKATVDAFLGSAGAAADPRYGGPGGRRTAPPTSSPPGRPLPLALSLSHSHGRALCAVAEAGTVLGCDLERIEPRSREFVASYFTVPSAPPWRPSTPPTGTFSPT